MNRKQRKISINYRPLQTSGNIEIVGSVPALQVYQADKKEYTPDYTITPLTLFPRCNATDPDAVTKIGNVNGSLVNMKWYERIGKTRTLITSTNSGYSITESGDRKGQITMKKNSSTLNPVTLEFNAEYVDTRTGQKFIYQFTQLARSIDGSEALPVLMLDSPSAYEWNPCREKSQQTITAKLIAGSMDVTSTNKCKFFWYRVLHTGELEQIIDGNGDNDFDIISISSNVLVIDRNYIGEEQSYVCKASYDKDGKPAGIPDAYIPSVSTAIQRKIPKVDLDWQGVPQGVANGTKVIYPKPIIIDTLGDIPNPSEIFICRWNTKGAKESSYKLAATGFSPAIPFEDGMMLELELIDRGPYCAVMSGDSYVFSGDSLVVARQNG